MVSTHHRSLVDYLTQARNGKIYRIQFHCILYLILGTVIYGFHGKKIKGCFEPQRNLIFHKGYSLDKEININMKWGPL